MNTNQALPIAYRRSMELNQILFQKIPHQSLLLSRQPAHWKPGNACGLSIFSLTITHNLSRCLKLLGSTGTLKWDSHNSVGTECNRKWNIFWIVRPCVLAIKAAIDLPLNLAIGNGGAYCQLTVFVWSRIMACCNFGVDDDLKGLIGDSFGFQINDQILSGREGVLFALERVGGINLRQSETG